MLPTLTVALLSFTAPTERLALDLDAATGQYTILVDAAPWFKSGLTGFTNAHVTKTTADGTLKISSRPGGKPATATGSGQDALGKFESTTIVWSEAGAATQSDYTTTFKTYKDLGGRGAAIVFEQHFPKGVAGTTLNASNPYSARDSVSTMFPSFVPSAGLGYLAFAGDMTGASFKHGNNFSTIPSGVSGTGPVCFFDKKLSAAVVISPFSQFMAASAGHARDGSLAYGGKAVTSMSARSSLQLRARRLRPTERAARARAVWTRAPRAAAALCGA